MAMLHFVGISSGDFVSRNFPKSRQKGGFRRARRGLRAPWNRAIQSVIEPLEQRVLLSVSATATNIHAIETESFDPGDLDGSGSVYVASGNSLSADNVRETSLTVDGLLTIDPGSGFDDPSHASVVSSLTMDTSGGHFVGTLDLTDNALIVEAATASDRASILAFVQAAISSGYNGGSWNGTGIISSTAASHSNYGLGFIVNDGNYNYSTGADGGGGASAIYSTFGGQSVDSNSIIVAYTLKGDTNLDGLVDGDDETTLDGHFGHSGTWATGDFTYDGLVSGDDLTALDGNFGHVISFSSAPDTTTAPQLVATFTGATAGLASDYTASINWGDGTSASAGTIVAEGGGNYAVVGTHTYPHDTIGGTTTGTYSMSVEVTETATGDNSTADSTADVTYLPDLMINGPASATSSAYSLDLSAMFATDFDGAANDISSWTVNWGDGNTQTYYQTSTFNPGWSVVTHSYSGTTGLFDITATAFDGTHTYMAPETIAVALNFSGSPETIQATQGESFSGPIATFQGTTDGDTSNYSATINWGDDSTLAGGTIAYEGSGTYEVTGSYTYAQEGTFGVGVTITEADDGAQVVVNSTADVAVAETTPIAVTLPGTLPTFSPAMPISAPTLPEGMNTFTLDSGEISGTAVSGAPVFAASDPTAQPDQTITVTGSAFTDYPGDTNAFSDTQFIVYGQTSSSNGTFSDAEIQDPTVNGAMLTLSTSEPGNSLYLVWAANGTGISAPIAVNQTTAWWAGAPDEPVQQSQSPTNVSTYLGQALSIYGENLSNGAATPESWVYLQPTGGGAGTWATVTAVNPYKVDITVPDTLTVGDTYQIWINNGLGGNYSWSEVPTTLSVAASSAPTWTGTTIDVATYGALGNGVHNDYSAIQDALNALAPGDMLEFPAGTYLVNYGDSDAQLQIPHTLSDVQITGASALTTTILFTGDVPDHGIGNFEFGQEDNGGGKIEFDNLTFEYNGNGLLSTGATATIGNSTLIYLNHSTGIKFDGVTLISGPLRALWAAGGSGGEMTIENSTVIGTKVYVPGETDVFLNSDDFFMGYQSEEAILDSETIGVSITNSTAQDYDDSADNPSGTAQARFTDFGLSHDQYVADNQTFNLSPDGNNDGEQNNAEGSVVLYSGSITVGDGTVQFDSTINLGINDGDSIVVTGGTGLGQLETIADVSYADDVYTLTLAGSWNDTPDSTSTVQVVDETYDNVFYANTLGDAIGANGNAGFELYSGGYGNVFDGNMVQNVITGVALDNFGGGADDFNTVANNQFEGTLQGVAIAPADDSQPNNTPDGVGVVVRDNTVMGGVAGIVASGIYTTWFDYLPVAGNSYPLTLTSIEHNLVAPSAETGPVHYPNYFGGIIPAGGLVVQGNNVDALLYDNVVIEPAPLEGSSYALPPAVYYDLPAPSASILLRNNQYSGFASNTYVYGSGVSSPSLFEMLDDVFYASATSGDTSALSIPLWDDGAASRSWSATIESGATWLAVMSGDSSSGTISGEDDDSSDAALFLTADSTGLSAGTHSATVTITAGGQTRVVTVVFTVT
jgi:hypothetical protein